MTNDWLYYRYTAFHFMLLMYAIYVEYTDVDRSQTIYEEYEITVG